jgi:N-acetylmuramoyl-L-alanine amidase
VYKKSFVFLLLLPAALAMARTPVKLQNIRSYSYAEYTRVVLDLSADLKISEKVIRGNDSGRLFFDLKNCRFAAAYPLEKKNEIKIKTGNLKQIRIGKPDQKTIRVVFDFNQIGKYTRFYLTSPFRIVFDIYSQDKFVSHAQESQIQSQATALAEGNPPGGSQPGGPGNPPRGGQPGGPGNPSFARQLGLGVHRIVIDPGHGGKDPGTVNRSLGLEEKNITLDIAKRLNAILNEHAELEVILTRPRDEYVALEERAAIANSNQGDIFISIHTNSAPRKTARGVEAYYLNITADPRAMEVAAQENAMSSKSMAEMRSILDQILQNSKIVESRILAQYMQANMVGNLKSKFAGVEDLGVKKAPFYVLLGAQMPSALVEVSFLSCNDEASRLATPEYRQAIAAGLYLGIINFIQSLGKP